MIYIVAIVAILIFIYVNRHVRARHERNKEIWRERREEYLQQLLDIKKKKNEN